MGEIYLKTLHFVLEFVAQQTPAHVPQQILASNKIRQIPSISSFWGVFRSVCLLLQMIIMIIIILF